jgi:hypothetical protein
MSSSYQYSCGYDLEYSYVDIFVIYELEYGPYIMIMAYLTRCFIVHTMFMNRFRLYVEVVVHHAFEYAQVLYPSIRWVGDPGGFGWFLCIWVRCPDI